MDALSCDMTTVYRVKYVKNKAEAIAAALEYGAGHKVAARIVFPRQIKREVEV